MNEEGSVGLQMTKPRSNCILGMMNSSDTEGIIICFGGLL